MASLGHAIATPAPSVTVGSHPGAVLSALVPALLVLLVVVAAVRAAARGRGALTGVLAVVAGWLLLVQGLPDVDVLWTANVLAPDPPCWPGPRSRCCWPGARPGRGRRAGRPPVATADPSTGTSIGTSTGTPVPA